MLRLSSHLNFSKPWMNCCPIRHFCYNRRLWRCLFFLFVKPLITSCQIRHLCKICHCRKNRQLSTCPFLSSHLNIWPNPWWFFWHTRHICRNLPFVNIPLFVTSFEVLPDRWWILAQFPFSQICHFWVNRQLSICLFCCLIVSILAKFAGFAKYVIFVKPTIIDMPLLSSWFNFCQILKKFLPNLSFS